MLTTYTLSNIAEASNNSDLSSKHNIGSTLDTIDKGLSAPIVVVKLAFGDRVVDIDSRDLELASLVHTIEVMNTSGSLLGETTDILEKFRVLFVNKVGEVATVVEDHVQRLATGEGFDSLLDTPVVFLICLTLPGEDGDAGSGYGSGSMVLSGEDVLEGDQIHVHDQLKKRKKHTQEDQVTSAPRAVRVSIKTAV